MKVSTLNTNTKKGKKKFKEKRELEELVLQEEVFINNNEKVESV